MILSGPQQTRWHKDIGSAGHGMAVIAFMPCTAGSPLWTCVNIRMEEMRSLFVKKAERGLNFCEMGRRGI